MSELSEAREFVELRLNELQAVFDETAKDAVELITDPRYALYGMATDSPEIETDLPLKNLQLGDTLYSSALLHLSVRRETPENDIALIGLLKRTLGPIKMIPVVRPPQPKEPVAISAVLREVTASPAKSIVPLTLPYEIDMSSFDQDLRTGNHLPDPEDVEKCLAMLRDINTFITYLDIQE